MFNQSEHWETQLVICQSYQSPVKSLHTVWTQRCSDPRAAEQSESESEFWYVLRVFFRRRRPPQPAALTDSSGIPGWVLMSWGFMLYLVSSPISSEFVFPLIYPKWKTLLLVLYGLCVNVKGLEPVFEWQLCLVFVCFFSSSGFKRNYCDLFTSHLDSFLHCDFFFFFSIARSRLWALPLELSQVGARVSICCHINPPSSGGVWIPRVMPVFHCKERPSVSPLHFLLPLCFCSQRGCWEINLDLQLLSICCCSE